MNGPTLIASNTPKQLDRLSGGTLPRSPRSFVASIDAQAESLDGRCQDGVLPTATMQTGVAHILTLPADARQVGSASKGIAI